MKMTLVEVGVLILSACSLSVNGFTTSKSFTPARFSATKALFGVEGRQFGSSSVVALNLAAGEENSSDVIELIDEEMSVKNAQKTEKEANGSAVNSPFLSQQNELAEGVLNPDMTDAKQARVILYLIISLLPVLALIPLMMGSRDFIPPESLPPVSM
jgi:hypothetical protein